MNKEIYPQKNVGSARGQAPASYKPICESCELFKAHRCERHPEGYPADETLKLGGGTCPDFEFRENIGKAPARGEIKQFGPLRCKWVFDTRVRLDGCLRFCKLFGAAICPRVKQFKEFLRIQAAQTKALGGYEHG